MSDLTFPSNMPKWITDHLEIYLKDGEAGHKWDATEAGINATFDTLLLFTTGRKSGNKVVLPLIYQPTGDGGYCIIASKGGAPTHPAWYLNLTANPEVEVQIKNDRFAAKARVAEGEERACLWQVMADYYPEYSNYQALTERQIPVVVLEPV